MGRKLNLAYRQREAKRMSRQKTCALCSRKSSPRYLHLTIDGYLMHRDCMAKWYATQNELDRQRQEQRDQALALRQELEDGVSWERIRELRKLYIDSEQRQPTPEGAEE